MDNNIVIMDNKFKSRVKLFHKEMAEYGQEVAERNEKVRYLGQAIWYFDSLLGNGMDMEDARKQTKIRFSIDIVNHQDEYMKAQDNNYFADYYQWNLQEEVEDKVEDNEFKNL